MKKLCAKKIFIVMFLLLVVPCKRSPAQSNRALENAVASIQRYYNAYDTINFFKELIKEDPKDYASHFLLSLAYDRIGLYWREAAILEEAIKYLPEDGSDGEILYGNLAHAYIAQGRWHKARPHIDEALKFNPKNIENRKHLIRYYLNKKEYGNVAAELKTISDLDQDRDFYHELLVYMLEEGFSADLLVDVFEWAAKVNEGNHWAHRALATAIRGPVDKNIKDNFEAAMKEFNKALSLAPQSIPTYISIADTYMLLARETEEDRHFDTAMEWFNKAYEIDPNNLRLAYAMGNLFQYTKQYDKAIEKYEYALENGLEGSHLIESLAIAYNNRAYWFYEQGENLDEGLALVEKAIELKPGSGVILSTKAEILYKMGKYNEAYEVIKKASFYDPEHPEIIEDIKMIEEALRGSIPLDDSPTPQ